MTQPEGQDLDQALTAHLSSNANRVLRTAPSTPIGGHTFNWRTLADNAAPAEWAALRAWVEWFTVRYAIPVSTVPNCWWQHGALVEELSALHTAHNAAFDRADAGFGPINWHERLTLALPRLTRAYGGGCNTGHKPTKPRTWTEATNEQEWDTWTTQAHAHDTHPGVTNRKETP